MREKDILDLEIPPELADNKEAQEAFARVKANAKARREELQKEIDDIKRKYLMD